MNIKLHIDRSDHLTNLYISELTNHARVGIEKIQYDPEKELAIIPLTRYRVVGGRKLLCLGEYQRDNTPIQSSAIIRNIKKAEITRADTCADIQEITLIFGITIKTGEISFGSAEEATGRHCFGATFFGDSLILEIEDI
jgi:hypothetical protein